MSSKDRSSHTATRLLTPCEMKLFSMLSPDHDTPIAHLYAGYYDKAPTVSPRRQQQALSWVKNRLNAKLAMRGLVMKPGIARRSYRLYPLEG